MDHATNEQIAAAPAELMLAAAYNRDSRAAFTLARKGIDITGRASEVIRQYSQRGYAWELDKLNKDGMKIKPPNLSAHKAGINAKRHAHVCIKIEALACAVVNHSRTGEACKAIHYKHIACSCLSTNTGSKRC